MFVLFLERSPSIYATDLVQENSLKLVFHSSLQTCFYNIFENTESLMYLQFTFTPALKMGNSIQVPSFHAENKEIYSMQCHVNSVALLLPSA